MTSPPSIKPPLLLLPDVTLCAVSSVNVSATVAALEASLKQASYAACKLLTNVELKLENSAIEIIKITEIPSSLAYSEFVLNNLVNYVDTSHCLLSQWDGHVISGSRWRKEFLDYDYIGASWPQFADGQDVGNGGFSLRSKRLMELCRSSGFVRHHPEDLAIGRTNRAWLEEQGIRFAPKDVANMFSAERAGDSRCSFGYHGAFNMPQVLGARRFYDIYRKLDSTGSVEVDFASILGSVVREKPLLGLNMIIRRILGSMLRGAPRA